MENDIQKVQEDLTPQDIMIAVLQTQKEQNKRLDTTEKKIEYLENEQPIHPGTAKVLLKKRKARVIAWLGGKDSQAYRDRRFAQSVFKEAELDFKSYFNIASYDLLPKRNELAAIDYWNTWEPSNNTKLTIKQLNNQMELIS